ncbi:MAG: hypothetical protein EP343_21860 [Deltaproteobacteria bacterium]|nr:MAG: hypothetical protein EP343_21860 [Deltaproteobacteria bacterium]
MLTLPPQQSQRPIRVRWLLLASLLVFVAVGCSGNQPPTTCTAGGCPSGTECVQDTYCLTTCNTGLSRCGLLCTNLQFDKAHCGACGTACKANELCNNGTCATLDALGCNPACQGGRTCQQGVCVCPSGEVDCNGTCAVLATSAQHCGACGNACGSGATCQQGVCTCASGQSYCNGQCIDTNANDANCGACGNACGTGLFCDVGKCVCSGGKTNCNGTCVDIQVDPNHCGACGFVCNATQTCSGGQCKCNGGLTACSSGNTTVCVNLKTSKEHCSRCNNACATGESCIGGACKTFKQCPDGQADCNGTCVDLNKDKTNCGFCGKVCELREDCVAGACKILQCQSGETRCGSVCVDLTSNASHCSGCNNSCAFNERCTQGLCTPICPTGQSPCSGACVDVKTNAQHCGACGKVCAAGEYCKQGTCTSYCTGGLTSCPSGCTNISFDTRNCGKCGTKCDTCTNGKCGCDSGKVNCNDQCADFLTDPNHCGKCYNPCPQGQSCSNGACSVITKTWYPDKDLDGFGDKNGTPVTANALTPPIGYVDNKLDTCDNDKLVHPNQTRFFTTPNRCGNYDYNSDGKEEAQQTLCTCSTGMNFDNQLSFNFSYKSYPKTGPTQFTPQDSNHYEKASLEANPVQQTSCELDQLVFKNPGAFNVKQECTNIVTRPLSYTACTNNYSFTAKSVSYTYSPRDTQAQKYIMWKTSGYTQGCLFNLDRSKPACGKKTFSAPAPKDANLLSLSNQYLGNKWFPGSACCNISSVQSYFLFVQGRLSVSKGYTLTLYPSTQVTVACQ